MKISSSASRYALAGATLLAAYFGLVCWDRAMQHSAAATAYEVDLAREQVRSRIAVSFRDRELKAILSGMGAGFELPITPNQFEGGLLRQVAEAAGVAPLGGQPLSDVMLCHDGVGQIRYRTDRFGFRNPDLAWDDPAEILVLGGAAAMGTCVDDDNTMSAQLRKRGHSVMNLAVPMAGPLHYAAVAKTFLPVLRPKYVVVGLHPTDASASPSSVYRKIFFAEMPAPYFSDLRQGSLPLGVSYELQSVYDAGRRTLRYPSANSEGVVGRPPSKALELTSPKSWSNSLALKAVAKRLRESVSGPDLPEPTRFAMDTMDSYCEALSCQVLYFVWPPNPTWIPQPGAEAYKQAVHLHTRSLRHAKMLELSIQDDEAGKPFFARGDEFYTGRAYESVAASITLEMSHASPATR